MSRLRVMQRPCLTCGVLIPKGTFCSLHVPAQPYRPNPNRASAHQRGYDSTYRRWRLRVLARDGYQCAYCGGRATTADHVVPVSRGGASTPDNMVAACVTCNSRKKDH